MYKKDCPNLSYFIGPLQGDGGEIQITTQGLFKSFDSLINASSKFGLDGAIEVNNPNDNNSIGLLELPTELVATDKQIVNACSVGRYNTFAVTGRGGLPENPTQMIRSRTVWQDLRPLQPHRSPKH